jgi:hypothetical protein
MRREASSPSALISAAFGLHAPIDGLAVGLRQVGALDAHIDHRDAKALAFRIHLLGDLLHQRVALVSHHGLEARGAKHAPQRGLEDRPKPRPGDAFIAHGLVEQQRIGNAPTGKGVNNKTLLVRGDHLLRRRVEIEQALVEERDVLDERNLEIQTGLGHEPLRLAELENERLLGLIDREQRQIGGDRDDAEQQKHDGEGCALHYCCPPS